MIASLFVLCCAAFGLWHFGRAIYLTFKYRYVMWSYSRGSSGSRVYEIDDPRRFRIGAWTNVSGLAFAVWATGFILHELLSGRLL
ncbi:hypothetical protein JKL49_12130 [Phenylobacterium sp. 20VBR1]|uniref:Uncharacterized protein n=1 Tax=Phenylobacterium glaciei TaxID=2803784 RepID=A0A941D0P7_9CAUL|nr:hypothetical protein [Phenylobacterium glaciei]MBR7620135.1 hypothetical protein [Phenylobacterium glaciei]